MDKFFQDMIGACCTANGPNEMVSLLECKSVVKSQKNPRRGYQPERREYWLGEPCSPQMSLLSETNSGNFGRTLTDHSHLTVIHSDQSNSNLSQARRSELETKSMQHSLENSPASATREINAAKGYSTIHNFRIEDQSVSDAVWSKSEPKVARWPGKTWAVQNSNTNLSDYSSGVQYDGWSIPGVESYGRKNWASSGLVPSTQIHTSSDRWSSNHSAASTHQVVSPQIPWRRRKDTACLPPCIFRLHVFPSTFASFLSNGIFAAGSEQQPRQ
jgi:hypothetical protein